MEKKTPFKELSFSQKIQYIWDYYKIPIFGTILAIIFILTIIRGQSDQKNSLLGILCVNANSFEAKTSSEIFDEFLAENNYDISENEITMNTNVTVNTDSNGADYQNMAVLTAYFGAQDYNLCLMDDTSFDYYAKIETFCDLRDYIDDDTLQKYDDYIVYAQTEDGEKFPCGIRLLAESNSWLLDSGLYSQCTLGICYSDSDTDLLKKVCGYILQ